MSLLNHYLVDLAGQGKSGIFEADQASVTDISQKIKGGTASKDEVKSMQSTLSRYGYLDESGVDGLNGPKTKAALKKFQEDIETGALTIDTLPESVTNAKSSIDGLSSAASQFASWVASQVPGSTVTPGTPGTAGTGVYEGSGGSGGGTVDKGASTGSLSQYTDAISAAASTYASSATSAATSLDSIKGKSDDLGSSFWSAKARVDAFKMPSFGGRYYEGERANGGITTGPEVSLVGEDGPEAIVPLSEKRRGRGLSLWKAAGAAMGVKMYADGGIVGNAETAAPSGSASVQVGGITIEINVNSGGSPDGVVEAIKAKMPEVANEVAGQIAQMMAKSYSNMPVAAEG
jgi:peptidoglycan hydrolase-like protein with peptidoglycan-binding domain